jgi:sodium/hydrogen antiporter
MLAAARLIPDLRYRHDALFVGWFGPIGVAALYYAALASRQLGDEQVWLLATLVITASILVHGVTADPFIRLYASAEGRRRATLRR